MIIYCCITIGALIIYCGYIYLIFSYCNSGGSANLLSNEGNGPGLFVSSVDGSSGSLSNTIIVILDSRVFGQGAVALFSDSLNSFSYFSSSTSFDSLIY